MCKDCLVMSRWKEKPRSFWKNLLVWHLEGRISCCKISTYFSTLTLSSQRCVSFTTLFHHPSFCACCWWESGWSGAQGTNSFQDIFNTDSSDHSTCFNDVTSTLPLDEVKMRLLPSTAENEVVCWTAREVSQSNLLSMSQEISFTWSFYVLMNVLETVLFVQQFLYPELRASQV